LVLISSTESNPSPPLSSQHPFLSENLHFERIYTVYILLLLLWETIHPLYYFCISFLSMKYSHVPNCTQCEQFTLNWDENCLSTFLFFLIHLIVSAYHFHHLNKWNECYYNGMHEGNFSLSFFCAYRFNFLDNDNSFLNINQIMFSECTLDNVYASSTGLFLLFSSYYQVISLLLYGMSST